MIRHPCTTVHSITTMLPVELLELIFKYCDKHSLRYLLPINSLFYALAAPLLYETVALDGLALWRLVGALKTLAQNQQLASLVKQLLIDISDFHEDPKLSAVHQSTRQNLQTALSGMVNLNHLRLRATTRYFAPPRGFDYVFAAIKSSSITSFHTNVAIYENLVALIAKQHSLVQLSVTGNLPVKYIKPFLKALSSCNLDYMQARLSVLMSIAPYHGFKRLAVPGTGYSSSFEIADFADTLRTTCPRYLDVKESFFFGQWLGMLHALAKSGTVLGFLSSKLFIEEDYEVESNWNQLSSSLHQLTRLQYLNLCAEDGAEVDEDKPIWERLENVCITSCPNLLRLWTPLGYLERAMSTASWPSQRQPGVCCHSCSVNCPLSPRPKLCCSQGLFPED